MKLSTIEINGNVKTSKTASVNGNVRAGYNVSLQGGIGVAYGGTRSKNIFVDTTANWDAQRDLIAKKDCIYVYSDYQTIDGVNIPAIKVGDGTTYLIDLPFVMGNDMTLNDHINDTNVHIQPGEREFWNNKVTCFLSASNEEIIVFTKENING